jgi:hypothetical protein
MMLLVGTIKKALDTLSLPKFLWERTKCSENIDDQYRWLRRPAKAFSISICLVIPVALLLYSNGMWRVVTGDSIECRTGEHKVGQTCLAEVAPTSTVPDGTHSECIDSAYIAAQGNYTSQNCQVGFTGIDGRCDVPIPFCQRQDTTSPCQHGGTCCSLRGARPADTPTTPPVCVNCDPGWNSTVDAPFCNSQVTYCEQHANTCLNGGICISNNSHSYSCDCQHGWTGERCNNETVAMRKRKKIKQCETVAGHELVTHMEPARATLGCDSQHITSTTSCSCLTFEASCKAQFGDDARHSSQTAPDGVRNLCECGTYHWIWWLGGGHADCNCAETPSWYSYPLWLLEYLICTCMSLVGILWILWILWITIDIFRGNIRSCSELCHHDAMCGIDEWEWDREDCQECGCMFMASVCVCCCSYFLIVVVLIYSIYTSGSEQERRLDPNTACVLNNNLYVNARRGWCLLIIVSGLILVSCKQRLLAHWQRHDETDGSILEDDSILEERRW